MAQSREKLNGTTVEFVHGMPVVKVFNRSLAAFGRFEADAREFVGNIKWATWFNARGMGKLYAAAGTQMLLLLPAVLMAVLEAAKDALAADVRLEGETNLLFFPESELMSTRRVIEFLNHRKELAQLLLHQGGSVRVLIGRENERPELMDSSVVVARYSLAGNEAGAIGVIGPTRMDYARMITSLEYLARSVGTLLSEILDIE